MQLLIVESPTKAKTLAGFLGKNYRVLSSFGHVRDLPKRELGVDVEHDFEPKYVVPAKARKVVTELKKNAEKADEVILATDEDREGESISWHLEQALKLKNPKRIVFHEITKHAIEEALKHPRQVDMHLVDAQQARRVIDRIVGYQLSPFLWKKISKGLSAGRVQSVALRLVVEREREIAAFKPQEYWSVEALLEKDGKDFSAQLAKRDGKAIEKLEIKNEQEAQQILKELEHAEYRVASVEKRGVKRNPLPPFATSTLQQTAANKFGYSSKFTMSLAQKLYEEGNITYHRTDSLNLSASSVASAKTYITKTFGAPYWTARAYKAKKGAQEAHEAIRPTYPDRTPESLSNLPAAQQKLYRLIWQRFMASQMTSARFDSVAAEIAAGRYAFHARGQQLAFDGFLKAYPMQFTETELPELAPQETLSLKEIIPAQHFTEPPARYNEAGLIKALEAHGIGRPSTYAPTLATIQDRHYVEKNEQRRFAPTEMGTLVSDMLVENFPEIVDIGFTSQIEEQLDDIARGKETWQKACRDFYGPFSKNLKEKEQTVEKETLDIATDKACPKCGKPMVKKLGRFGRFYACTGFPECRHTESLESEKINVPCPRCKHGEMVMKKSKRGRVFYGCSAYPACDFAVWDKPVNEFCPRCKSLLVETKRGLVKCSNKECGYKKSAANDGATSQKTPRAM